MSEEREPTARTTRRLTRRRGAAVAAAGASALLAAAGVVQLQGASAEPISNDIAATCVLGTSNIDVTVPLTVDDKVDPVAEGSQSILETKTGLPSLPVEVTINKLVVTTPIPTPIASTDAVTFGEGNVTPSYEVIGSDLVVTFTGPVSSSAIQVPSVTATQTVATGTGATSIDWRPFSKIDADTSYGMATCTPNDPNQIMNSTTVTAEAPPTTEPSTPPSTDPSTPPTTEPSTPPTTEPSPPPSTTPPTTAPPSAPPSSPLVPGLPVPVPTPPLPVPAPPLPVPAPPSLPAPPAVPAPPVPTLPAPGEPCPATGLPPLPVVGCPTAPDPDIDVDAEIDIDIEVGIGF